VRLLLRSLSRLQAAGVSANPLSATTLLAGVGRTCAPCKQAAGTVRMSLEQIRPVGFVLFSNFLNKFKSAAKLKILFKFDLKSEKYEINFFGYILICSRV
jgi:hypothetical protein